jgi:hypothetical protein
MLWGGNADSRPAATHICLKFCNRSRAGKNWKVQLSEFWSAVA